MSVVSFSYALRLLGNAMSCTIACLILISSMDDEILSSVQHLRMLFSRMTPFAFLEPLCYFSFQVHRSGVNAFPMYIRVTYFTFSSTIPEAYSCFLLDRVNILLCPVEMYGHIVLYVPRIKIENSSRSKYLWLRKGAYR